MLGRVTLVSDLLSAVLQDKRHCDHAAQHQKYGNHCVPPLLADDVEVCQTDTPLVASGAGVGAGDR